jgi:diacylglycerol kinase (ATP)
MGVTSDTGLRRIVKATGYSLAGLKAAWRHEAAFRQEAMLMVLLVPAGVWLGRSGTERAVLIGSAMVVVITELLNSAVEAVVDRTGLDHHPLSGRAKDLGSAAVFVSLANVVLVWSLIAFARFR